MKFSVTEKGYILRLIKGEELVGVLSDFCKTQNIHSGILHGIGASESTELAFYDLNKKEYQYKKFESPMEIVSLTGNISLVDENPFIHMHGVFSDSSFNAFGGHLKCAIVGATCEIYLTSLNIDIHRVFDDEVGLKLLDCIDQS